MRVLVCGGRDFQDRVAVHQALDDLDAAYGVSLVIDGGATGADKLAAEWAWMSNKPNRCFPADWKTYGRGAGPIRNKQMLDEGKPDLVLAFPGGRGTANMVKQAQAAGVRVECKT